jgi:hypothetical protein
MESSVSPALFAGSALCVLSNKADENPLFSHSRVGGGNVAGCTWG